MTRSSANPVLTTADTGTGGVTCADPFLWVINDKLYCFFESTNSVENGQIWMGSSDDGVTWGDFVQVSTFAGHYAHPTIYEGSGVIHCYAQYANGFVTHRSSPVSGFPDWSAEEVVFDSVTLGWHHHREFDIFKHSDGNYYLLGVTGDGTLEDQQVRGMWCASLTDDWNTDGTLISADPLLDCDEFGWLRYIVEITRVQAEGRLILYFGAIRLINTKQAISTYEVTGLDTTSMTGHWITNDHTFGLSASGWDSENIHRASAAYFGGRWVYAYDALKDGEWRIGFAYR